MPRFGGNSRYLLRYLRASLDAPDATPTAVADCLTQPTAMVIDKKTGKLYVTELTGRIVAIPLQ